MDNALTPTTIINAPLPTIGGLGMVQQPGSSVRNDAAAGLFTPDTVANVGTPQQNIATDVSSVAINTSQNMILSKMNTGTNGNISDSKNNLILDQAGIRSLTQFNINQISQTPIITTSSNTYQDVSGSSFSITTVRDIRVLFTLAIDGYCGDGSAIDFQNYVEVILYDSFLGGQLVYIFTPGTNIVTYSAGVANYIIFDLLIGRSKLATVQAGTHNYKLQYRSHINGKQATLVLYELTYAIYGF